MNWIQKLLEVVKDSQQTQPKTRNPIVQEQVRPVQSEQQSGSSVLEIENVPNLAAKTPMKEQGDLSSSCVPVSVERVDKDKDADENVDADHVRTTRHVESEQSIEFVHPGARKYTLTSECLDCHNAVVKQADNFQRSRTREEDRESSSSTSSSSRFAIKNNAYNPFSEESKVMIREMGNAELFELCETIPKVQCSECLLYWNQGVIYCTCAHLLKESEASQHFHHRRLDAFSIENYVIKKGRPRGARHGKSEAQKEHFMVHAMRGGDVLKNEI